MFLEDINDIIGSGINRNIVECKYETVNYSDNFLLVLIETLWNVNHLTYYLYL